MWIWADIIGNRHPHMFGAVIEAQVGQHCAVQLDQRRLRRCVLKYVVVAQRIK